MIDVNLYWGGQSGCYRMAALPRAGETILIDRKLWSINRVEWSLGVGSTLITVSVLCVPYPEESFS